MAFICNDGERVSFDAHDLIVELREDIAEFGGDRIVYVVTQRYKDVKLYKDYELANGPCDFETGPNEDITEMTMNVLLILYEEESRIL